MHLALHEIIGMRDTARWHTRIHARVQTVAEHGATTALLARWLAPKNLDHRDRADLLELGLTHDAHENPYGDLPYPAKQAMKDAGIDVDALCQKAFWGSRGLPQLKVSDLVMALVEAADALDAALYAKKWLPEIFAECSAKAIERSADLPMESRDRVHFALYGPLTRTVREMTA